MDMGIDPPLDKWKVAIDFFKKSSIDTSLEVIGPLGYNYFSGKVQNTLIIKMFWICTFSNGTNINFD